MGTWFIQFLTFWVAYSHMIPISLYVMIEVMKLFLGKLIRSDEEMRDKETGMYSDVRNSDLIEELGQVQFVFSDKTGTLTVNQMIYKKMSVSGLAWPDESPHDLDYPDGNMDLDPTYTSMMKGDSKEGADVREYMRLLSLCHSVVVERDETTGELKYQSPSPDEEALVKAAAENDIVLEKVTKDTYEISEFGEHKIY